MSSSFFSRLTYKLSVLVGVVLLAFLPTPVGGQSSAQSLELSRPARSWEFLAEVGTRAGLFGNEAGNFEAWVYPLSGRSPKSSACWTLLPLYLSRKPRGSCVVRPAQFARCCTALEWEE